MVPSWLLDEIAQQLESQAERQQIHQLAFAANQQRWLDDLNILELYRLRDLVQDLTRSYHSFEELKQGLRHALRQAPESRALIPAARTLLQITRQAYQGDRSAAALPSEDSLDGFQSSELAAQRLSPFETRSSDAKSHPFPPLPYDEIAATLEQSPSSTRIKKLLYAACSGEWTNDSVVLGRFRLTNLLQQLHKMSADEESLHSALRNVVVTLNRQMEYELVAQLIQRECHRLYSPLEEMAKLHSLEHDPQAAPSAFYEEDSFSTGPNRSSGSGVDPVPLGFYDDDSPSEPTGMLIPMGGAASQNHSLPEEGQAVTAAAAATEQPNQFVAYSSPASSPSPGPWTSPDYNPHYAHSPQAQSGPMESPARIPDWQGLAELRVDLMRYANPLRVKALAFSTLYHPFELDSGGDWSKLQTETLGDLILRLMEQFTSHASLDEQLKLMACQLRPRDEYGNAAGAIARALRPFYP